MIIKRKSLTQKNQNPKMEGLEVRKFKGLEVKKKICWRTAEMRRRQAVKETDEKLETGVNVVDGDRSPEPNLYSRNLRMKNFRE